MSKKADWAPYHGAIASADQVSAALPDIRCYGVNGWLKLFIVFKLYIAPVIFLATSTLFWIGYIMLTEKYFSLFSFMLIGTVVDAIFVCKWISIATDLRDIKPRAVQETKRWLKLSLGLVVLSAVLSFFMPGMDPKNLFIVTIRKVVFGLFGFVIWYTYFNVSKRVKATYPDHKNKQFLTTIINETDKETEIVPEDEDPLNKIW